MISLTYIITSAIVILLPGPGSLYTVSTAMNHAKNKGIVAAIGCTFGIIPHLSLGIIALYLMQQLPPDIMNTIKLIGALYLVYLGYKMITSADKIALSSESVSQDKPKLFIQGIMLNLLNPKLTLFFISFLPQYINKDKAYIIQALSLGLMFMVLSLIIFICYALLAGEVGKKLLTSRRRILWMNRVFGILFVLFAVQLFL